MRPVLFSSAFIALTLSTSFAQDLATSSVKVTRSGTQPSTRGDAAHFTGVVAVDAPFRGQEPSRVGGATVTFEPGARTAWHSHPLGQTLIVTAGVGRVQQWQASVQEIRSGDVVWIPPNVKHWHGAAPTTGMTHIAVAESVEGKGVTWMEQVDIATYARNP